MESFQVLVKGPVGSVQNVSVLPTDTIAQVKTKLRDAEVNNSQVLRLSFQGIGLEDRLTVAECQLQHKSVLLMEKQTRNLSVITPIEMEKLPSCQRHKTEKSVYVC